MPAKGNVVGYFLVYDERSEEKPPTKILIFEFEPIEVGCDPEANTLCYDNKLIARCHFSVHVVVYDKGVHHVYVADRGSSNGTFVNGNPLGNNGVAYLLLDGDEVKMPPNLRFCFKQRCRSTARQLTRTQKREAESFKDKYAITRRCIGAGAEAAVFLAQDAVTKKQLTCKIYDLDTLKNIGKLDAMRRCLQEADILRDSHHPNILGYEESYRSPHSLYIFSELATGGDLMSLLCSHAKRGIPVDSFLAKVIVRQVVQALVYLHEKNIVHRDLKPENILLSYFPHLGYHRVLLSDFGTYGVPNRSRMTSMVGTELYQAPEISTTRNRQTCAVDMWSLGVTTLLLLCPQLINADLEYLKLLKQREIYIIVDDRSRGLHPPSKNGKAFVRDCLQLDTSKRLTSLQAEGHNWLNKPSRHLQKIQEMDSVRLSAWNNKRPFKPMPSELPELDCKQPESLGSQSAAPTLAPNEIASQKQRLSKRKSTVAGKDDSAKRRMPV